MESLLGRSLSHNFTNVLFSPFLSLLEKHKNVDFRSALEHEPDAAAGRNILSEAAWLSKCLNRLGTNFPSGYLLLVPVDKLRVVKQYTYDDDL